MVNRIPFGTYKGHELTLKRQFYTEDWTWCGIEFFNRDTKFTVTLGTSDGVNTYEDNHQVLRKMTTQVIDALTSADAAEAMKQFWYAPVFHTYVPLSILVMPRGEYNEG